MYSISYKTCLDYWNEHKKFYYERTKFIYGLVADSKILAPYMQRASRFFNYEFNTPITVYKNSVYIFFKSEPTPEEFAKHYKTLLSYLKQQSISQDFQ